MTSAKNKIIQSLYRDYENNYLGKNNTTQITLSVLDMINVLEYLKDTERSEFHKRIESDDGFRIYALKVFIKWIHKLSPGQRKSFSENLKAIKTEAQEISDEATISFIRDILWEFSLS